MNIYFRKIVHDGIMIRYLEMVKATISKLTLELPLGQYRIHGSSDPSTL